MRKLLLIIVLFYTALAHGKVDTIGHAINNRELLGSPDSTSFSFFAVGHIYGSPRGTSSFPSPSVLMQVDSLNTSEASFLMLLGDNYRKLDDLHVSNFKNYLLADLNIPVFNVVGNHDLYTGKEVQNYDLYQKHFGATYYKFCFKNNLFVVLDGELADGNIEGDQLSFFKQVVQEQIEQKRSKNIFLFSHRDIWLQPNENFTNDIVPLLDTLVTSGTSVYWFSGDMNSGINPLYFEKRGEKITFLHNHIADDHRDKWLEVRVDQNDQVAIEAISLLGLPTQAIEEYTELRSSIKEPFDLAKKVKNTLTHPVYYIGFLSALAVYLLFRGSIFLFNLITKHNKN